MQPGQAFFAPLRPDVPEPVSSAQNVTGDHHPLGLRCTFIDLGDLGVPHQALHFGALAVAISAVDLDGLIVCFMAASAANSFAMEASLLKGCFWSFRQAAA